MTETPPMPVHIRRDRFDPVGELVRMREEAPLSRMTLPWGMPAWLATRYDAVRTVLGDATRFSNSGAFGGRRGPMQGAGEADRPNRTGFLLGYDPPEHTRLRKLLTAEFTVARMRRLRPRVETIVTEHLDALAAAGAPADLVADFALPVPSLVICELLGVPYSDRDEFQRLSRARLDMSRDIEIRAAAGDQARAYMAGLIAEQRRSPGDGLLGRLIREHGDEIGDTELTGVADLLLLAGHETTSNMLGLGTLVLLRDPDQLAALRDPSRVDNSVEELLRYLSVVHTVTPRMALTDVTLDGVEIKAGEVVLCSLPAANRDPSLGDDLDRVDLSRAVTTHVAFGHGIHHCIGAPLARMEMRIAYPALFDRFPTLRLAIPFEEVQFRAFSVVYGLSALPVAW
ncbi:MAG TPA: cytochrome P450 [Pseudonocardiaceae bacterium]|jgi:cytochrome P450|nr:cytochrome P450 [Pseudonocardiaceae bacterium]